jgi:Tol biopolymer transport system component
LSQVDFVAPGYLAYVRNKTLFAQPFDLQRLELTGEPVPVVDGVMTWGASQKFGYFSFSTNGTLVYCARQGPGQTLVWRDRTGQKIGTLGAVAEYRGIALSPDERTLAASIGVPWESDTHIWLLDVARGTATRFTTGPTIDTLPVWAADGQTLYFWSDRTGPARVYQKSLSASSEERELPLPPGEVTPADTSSDGRLLACVRGGSSTGNDIQMVSLGSGTNVSPVLSSAFNEREPRLSPDGKWLAFTSNESGVDEVYVVPYPGLAGKWQISTGGGKAPEWRADGKELFYLTGSGFGYTAGARGELMSVVVSTVPTFRAEKPVRLFGDVAPLTDVFGTSYAVTADGKRFLVRMFPGSQTPAAVTVIQDWASTVRRE